MSSSANSAELRRAETPRRSLSAWSVVALVLFALAVLAPVPLVVIWPQMSGWGPAEGAALAFLLFVCVGGALACAVLGVLTGWVGIRRSRGYAELPWAGPALNGAVLHFPLVLLLVLLPGSETGSAWAVVPMLLVLAGVFALLVGAREFIGRPKRAGDPAESRRVWRAWIIGVACGTGVMVGVLRLCLAARG